MEQRSKIGLLILLMTATLIMGGCGWITGGDTSRSVDSSAARAALSEIDTRADFPYAVATVTPKEGPLPGGEPVHITGNFPASPTATDDFIVYFGGNPAPFDSSIALAFTANDIYVTAPPGDYLGLVDILIAGKPNGTFIAGERDAYRYIDPHQLFAAVPDTGPVSGGTYVTIKGEFPVLGPITNMFAAQAAYAVYFGGNEGRFTSNQFGYYITPTEMFVLTPQGDAAGPVDVTVSTNIFGTQTLEDGFSYYDDFAVTSVNPVRGPLAGGTPVELRGHFRVTEAIYSLFEANSFYSATFDGNLATFTPNAAGQIITADIMYVTTPPGTVPDLVDVTVLSSAFGASTLYDGFRYYGDFELFTVEPDNGHITGGDLIVLNGNYEGISEALYDIVAARDLYNVFFGSEPAGFADFSVTGDPIITSDAMYVVAPPGLAVGHVEVSILALNDIFHTYATYTPGLNLYEYTTHMRLAEIYPDNGPFGANTAVQVLARLPITSPVFSLALAESIYSVTIDEDPAAYNTAAFPLIEITSAYGEYNAILNMLTPPGKTAGLKNAALIDVLYFEPPAKLAGAYTYNSLMTLVYIYENFGPLEGGNPIDVYVNLPVIDLSIDSMIEAELLYNVDIDTRSALWRVPAIEPLAVLSADYYGVEVNYVFHMIAPPGESLGLKPATIFDVYNPNDFFTKDDAYTYIAGDGIGSWESVIVSPNPVGPLDPGELTVSIGIFGQVDNSFEAFIVPQGGNPFNQNHRIALIRLPGDTAPTTWTGTNATAITTQMYGDPSLFADGHAAVYLYTDADGIIGDDFIVPYTENGLIAGTALTNRHFIIDTIPPIMLAPGLATDLVINSPNATNFLTPGEVIGDEFHPYTGPAITNPNITMTFPASTGLMTQNPFDYFLPLRPDPLDPLRRAQRFFNVASISNWAPGYYAPFQPLFLNVNVIFQDVDVYTALNVSPNPIYADRFEGGDGLNRIPAGFIAETLSISGTEQVLLGDPGNLFIRARWALQGGSTSMPLVTNVRADYIPNLNTPSVGGFVFQNRGIPSVQQMTARWSILSGINPEGISDPMHLVTNFVAGDRATIYLPNGIGNELTDARSVMTRQEDQIDPLHIWWMREVNTDFIRHNIPASGKTRNPSFEWEIANRPRPELSFDPSNSQLDPQPVFMYQLWRSKPSSNLEEFRDGKSFDPLYEKIETGAWLTDTTLNPLEVQSLLGPNPDNRWYILVVFAIDEAGNAERWPEELILETTPELLDGIGLYVEPLLQGVQSSSTNWKRFYYPALSSEIDTEATPLFWHDTADPFNGVPESGEANFGSQTRIPLPPAAAYFPAGVPTRLAQRVEAAFRIEALNIPDDPLTSTDFTWELYAEGSLVNSGSTFDTIIVPRLPDPQNQYFYGDPNRLKSINYLFRVATRTVDASGNINTDSTPVNIRFTVVPDDDIAKFLRNVLSDDNQPIKETDRP